MDIIQIVAPKFTQEMKRSAEILNNYISRLHDIKTVICLKIPELKDRNDGKIKLSGKLIGAFGLVGTFGISQVSGKHQNISKISHSVTYHIDVISENQIKSQRLSRSPLVPELLIILIKKEKQIKSIEETRGRAMEERNPLA